MRRRDLAIWPLAARAQQGERMRKIGVLVNGTQDPQGQAQLAAFQHALQQLGWSEGDNVHIDTRWGANDLDRSQKYAKELVALAPDVILASSSPSVVALQRVTHTVPIVFVRVADPLGAGFVDTLSRPGGS